MADYEKFKKTGLSRVVLASNGATKELITVPPPITTYNPPALKRNTFREGRKQAPKRVAREPGQPMVIKGHFTEFLYTKHTGFIIGRFKPDDSLCTYTVKGTLPVIDLYYRYQLRCTELFNKSVFYQIESLYSTPTCPSLSVIPIPGTSFVKILMMHCRYSKEEAQKIVFDVYAPISKPSDYGVNKRLKVTVIVLEFDYLCRNFSQADWFKRLSETWVPLRFKDFPKLLELGWDISKLSRFTPDQIVQLSMDIAANPWNYLVEHRNIYNLPPLKEDKIIVMNRLFGTQISSFDVHCIRFYEAVSEYIQTQKKISLTELEFNDIKRDCQFPPFFEGETPTNPGRGSLNAARKLMVVKYERDATILEARYYRWHEHQALTHLAAPLRRIMHQNTLTIPTPTELQQQENARVWDKFDPNPEQRECYNRLSRLNILLITGGPGTGKSSVISILKTRYRNSTVGVFASYGSIADALSEKLGVEVSTLAMAIDQVEKGNSNGDRYARMQVAFIDEISLVDLVTFQKFLDLMTNLKVLVMTGDECQSIAIAACPIVYGLLKKWNATLFVQVLTQVYRTASPILLSNLTRLRFGDYHIQYATRLDSDHPFILQHRLKIPVEFLKDKSDAARLGRVSILKKDLEPIYRHYEFEPDIFDSMLIVTQRIVDVRELNHAWWCLKHNQTVDARYLENEFSVGETIMFVGDNLNNPDMRKPAHLRSSNVKNKSTAIISAIWDFQPFCDEAENPYTRAIAVRSTDARKEHHMERVIQFSNGHQINLREYPLSNLHRGYAVTTSSVQGLQCKLLIYYVQPGQTTNLTREEFYTGCSRSSGRVVVITEVKNENLHGSDIARIMANPAKRRCDIVPIYLPHYETKRIQEEVTNPFEALTVARFEPTPYEIDSLSNSSLFGGLFSTLSTGPVEGFNIVDENANM